MHNICNNGVVKNFSLEFLQQPIDIVCSNCEAKQCLIVVISEFQEFRSCWFIGLILQIKLKHAPSRSMKNRIAV